MHLVLLAAGHGRRFGGLKQLAPVGPNGEAIMDYTAQAALSCGYAGVVVIVRAEIRGEIAAHIHRRWPAELDVELVVQAPVPGTAQAVLSARPAVPGPFAVANADDLYGDAALDALATGFQAAATTSGRAPHVLVGYRLFRTVLTSGPVTRGVCVVGREGALRRIVEHTVLRQDDGSFRGRPAGSEQPFVDLSGRTRVSMNLWGFHARVFDPLEEAIGRFDPERAPRRELLLPDVMNNLVSARSDAVQVVGTAARCIGVTHQEDLPLVRSEIAEAAAERLSAPRV